MPERGTQSPSDYIIKEAIITNSNLLSDVIIGKNIAQLVLYEDIRLPYMTGELIVKDDQRLFDTVMFNGTEILKLTIQQAETNGKEVTKEFVIQRVNTTKKLNDQSEVISLRLIQRHAFENNLIRFSKAYTDTPENIIKKILIDQLGIELSLPTVLPAQDVMKVVIPYMTPLAACEWIRDRMSTPAGFPYAFYQSLNDDVICLKSYEEILTEPIWNTSQPYRFSQAATQSGSTLTAEQQAFNIEAWEQPNADDMLAFIRGGSIATDVNVLDVTTGKKEFFHYSMDDAIKILRDSGVIPNNQISDFRMQYEFKDRELGSNNAFVVDRIIMNNTYGNDVNNYYQETTQDKFKLDAMNRVIRTFLEKSPVNVRVQGGFFLSGKNTSIGKNISVVYMNNDAEVSGSNMPDETAMKDYKRSGKYMIAAARHSFANTRHITSLTLNKIANDRFVKVFT